MKNIQVKEIYQVHGTATDIIPEDTHLENIIERFAQEPGLRGVFLIDSRQYLSGVITRADIMRLVHFQLFSGQGRPDIRVFELFHFTSPQKFMSTKNHWLPYLPQDARFPKTNNCSWYSLSRACNRSCTRSWSLITFSTKISANNFQHPSID